MSLKIQTKIPNEKHPNWYDRHILKMHETKYGVMTSEIALAEALKAEQGFEGHGIFTTVYLELKMKSECLFDYARLLEIEERENATTSN